MIDRKLDHTSSRKHLISTIHVNVQGQNQVHLSPDFPPKERTNLVLLRLELGLTTIESLDLEIEHAGTRENFEELATDRR